MPVRDECPTCGRPRDDDWVVWCPVSRTLADMLREEAGMTTEYPVTMRLGTDDVIVVQQHYPQHLDGGADHA